MIHSFTRGKLTVTTKDKLFKEFQLVLNEVVLIEKLLINNTFIDVLFETCGYVSKQLRYSHETELCKNICYLNLVKTSML